MNDSDSSDRLNLPDDGEPIPGIRDDLAGCSGIMFALLLAIVLILLMVTLGGTW